MDNLNVLELWALGMLIVVPVAWIASRKKAGRKDSWTPKIVHHRHERWKPSIYNPKEFRRPRK